MSEILNENLKEYKISRIPYIHLLGRNVSNALKNEKPVSLFWGASGLEIKAKSSEVWALVETDYSVNEVWACVWINGRIISRFMLEKGKKWICLCRGFSEKTVNTICFMRDSQAMCDDLRQICLVHSFALAKNGEFLPIEKKKPMIEFVGDSITSGEGLVGSIKEEEWISTWISPSKTYAVQAANALNADFSLISQCGWGVVTGWNNNRNTIIPPYYEQVCGLCSGENQKRLGSIEKFDFSICQNDFVFVNLGTNDSGAFNSPPWIENGIEYKMRKNLDGSYFEEDAIKISYGVKDFLKIIRKNNPKARICWIWGMLEIPELSKYLEKGVSMYIAESKDKKVDTMVLQSMSLEVKDEDKGSRFHPGPLTHKNAAKKIFEYCKKFHHT
jgi:hypothetical protein